MLRDHNEIHLVVSEMKRSDGRTARTFTIMHKFNPLNAELNPICYLLALLGAHHFLHVSRIRVNALSAQRIMKQISRTVVTKTQISLLK